MVNLAIVLFFFLVGINGIISLLILFINERWIVWTVKNNKNYLTYCAGILLLDIAGMYLFFRFLMAAAWA